MLNATPSLIRRLAAVLGLGLALPLTVAAGAAAGLTANAEPAGFDARLTQQLREVRNRAQQTPWVNPWLPEAARESADSRLQALVAGYTRAALDRGGWSNPWVGGDTYAAGEPLRAVAVGRGLTTGGEPQSAPARVLAAR